MAAPSTAIGADDVICIETKYAYVTARSEPRERRLMSTDCPVCNIALGRPCVRCTSLKEKCPIVFGVCSHAFHQHCVAQWDQPRCPACTSPWQVERVVQQD